MSADEFVSWQAFERFEPFGFPWANWVQSRIAAFLDWTLKKRKQSDYRTAEELRWKPPEPLFITRQRLRAQRRKERDERRSTQVRGE